MEKGRSVFFSHNKVDRKRRAFHTIGGFFEKSQQSSMAIVPFTDR